MEALAIEAVLEFLDRNGFPRASAALRDDILSRAQSDLSRPDGEGGGGEEDTGELGREDDFSAIPALLPRVRTSGDRRGDGETDSNFTLRPIPSSSSSSSDEAFVSMGSSPTDLTNPYGLWPTTRQAESGEDDNDNDSNRQSEFGTARDYMEPSVFSDTVCWFNDTLGGSSWNQPFLTRTFSGGSGGAADSSAGGGFPTGRDADRWSENNESSDFLSDANASWVGTAGPKPGKGCRDCSDYFPAHCDLCSGTAVKELHSTESGLDRDEDQNDSIFTLAEEDKDADSAPHSNAMDGNYETGFRDTVHPDVFGQVRDQFYMSGQQQLPEKELHMLSINGNTGEEPGTKLRGEYDPSWRIENAKEDNIHDIFAVNSKTFRTQDDIDSHSISEEPSNVTNVNGTIDFKEYENIHENNDLEVSGEEKSNSPQVLDFPDEEYEVFELRVVHRKNRTGFEENKDMPIIMNTLIAGRYYVTEYLGSAAFSKVIQAHDLHTGVDVCLKIIKNDKDFFDQSLDEIKLLKFVNKHDPLDEHHMLRLYDYFYHQEHLFIVCELLKANLYEFQKYNLESGGEAYFTLPRIQSIALQCLEALEYLHSLGIIHCDLKPENILIKSYSRCEIKIIDLGSSCFHTDHLGFYVQSRSYRAPEVILGLPYGQKIDIWSLGCVLAELYSGDVLFANESLEVLLGRMMGILGPFDLEILEMGQETGKYFTKDYDLFCQHETGELEYIIPQRSSLASHLGDPDPAFLSFLQYLLHTNPNKRPSAAEALHHPWLSSQQW